MKRRFSLVLGLCWACGPSSGARPEVVTLPQVAPSSTEAKLQPIEVAAPSGWVSAEERARVRGIFGQKKVRVLHQGEAPRKPLQNANVQRQEVKVRAEMSFQIFENGEKGSAKQTFTGFDLLVEPTRGPAGELALVSVLDVTGSTSRDMLRAESRVYSGAHGIDYRKVDADTPCGEQMNTQLATILEQMVARLPTEPVGVGATWQTFVEAQGAHPGFALITYTLTQRQETVATIAVEKASYAVEPKELKSIAELSTEIVDQPAVSATLKIDSRLLFPLEWQHETRKKVVLRKGDENSITEVVIAEAMLGTGADGLQLDTRVAAVEAPPCPK